MTYFSPEQVKENNCKKMGNDLGEIYTALWQELAHCRHCWHQYVELFGSSETRIDLLNRAAPVFFAATQDVFWERTLLHIARLTDPAKSVGKRDPRNLSVNTLLEFISEGGLQSDVVKLIEDATKKAEFARDWRNRLLAHRDLDVALDRTVAPLKTGSRKSVKDALVALEIILNCVEAHYTNSTTSYDAVGESGDASCLLTVIEDGVRVQTEREQRLAQGEWREDDMPRKL